MKLHVVAIHGIGSTAEPGFSERLHRKVLARLLMKRVIPSSQEMGWYPVLWAEKPASLEEEVYRRLYPQGEPFPLLLNPFLALLRLLGLDMPRRFAIHYIGDIFIYYSQYRSHFQEPLAQALEEIAQHHRQDMEEGRRVYFSLVGHSFGSVIAFDFLHESVCQPDEGCQLRSDRPFTATSSQECYAETMPGLFLTGLLTLGSPLALFSLRQDPTYHQFQIGARPFAYLASGVWFNFYDDQDWISFPLAPIFNQPGARFVADVVVNNSLTPLRAHGGYWSSGQVAGRLAQMLARDWGRP